MSVANATTETKLVTGDELFEMGDIGPAELIDGRVVPMSPTGGRHGRIELRLGRQLDDYVTNLGNAWVVLGEVGIYIRRQPDRVRAADVAVFNKQTLPEVPEGYLPVAPDLAVEIVSPTDRWADLRQKVQDYFSIGVTRVWVVEPDNQAVLVFRSATEFTTLGLGDTLRGEGLLAGFEVPVATVLENRPLRAATSNAPG